MEHIPYLRKGYVDHSSQEEPTQILSAKGMIKDISILQSRAIWVIIVASIRAKSTMEFKSAIVDQNTLPLFSKYESTFKIRSVSMLSLKMFRQPEAKAGLGLWKE